MLVERLLIAAVFLAAAASVAFGGDRLFVAAWLLAVPLGVWVLFRRVIRVNRRPEAAPAVAEDPDAPTP